MGEDVKRLRELLEKATPRPWERGQHVKTEWWWAPQIAGPALLDDEALPDADLIVAAVNALPALLDVVEAVKAQRAAIAQWVAHNPGDPSYPWVALEIALDRLEHSDAHR